jgi:hypothetical protein
MNRRLTQALDSGPASPDVLDQRHGLVLGIDIKLALEQCAKPLRMCVRGLRAPVSRTNSQKQSVPIFAQGFEADQPFGRLDRLIAVAERIGVFGALLE